ncbi:hypothetical protein JCM10212_000796 [Sporobolomyces blumeae]
MPAPHFPNEIVTEMFGRLYQSLRVHPGEEYLDYPIAAHFRAARGATEVEFRPRPRNNRSKRWRGGSNWTRIWSRTPSPGLQVIEFIGFVRATSGGMPTVTRARINILGGAATEDLTDERFGCFPNVFDLTIAGYSDDNLSKCPLRPLHFGSAACA